MTSLPRLVAEAEMYDLDGAHKPPSKVCVYTILNKLKTSSTKPGTKACKIYFRQLVDYTLTCNEGIKIQKPT